MVELSEKLQELDAGYLSAIEQIGLMQDLNQAVQKNSTKCTTPRWSPSGWHGRRGLLVLTNAGHPTPLGTVSYASEWSWLETQRRSEEGGRAGFR